MNKTDKYLLNNVNLFLSICAEKNCIIKTKNIIDMFGKIFKNDLSYIKLCPDGLEQDLQNLVLEINKYQTESFKSSLKILLTCFYDEIRYYMISNPNSNLNISQKDKDIIWFKALISRQVSFNMLAEYGSNAEKFNNFKVEHSQIGALLSKYYSEKDTEKATVIKGIINSKVKELYARYNISFTLPICAA